MEVNQHQPVFSGISAVFSNNPKCFMEKSQFKISFEYIFRLLQDKETPIREISDIAIREYICYLLGQGVIYELGAPNDYYKKFVPPEQKYEITDYSSNASFCVDMTQMPFPDNSVDAFFSAYALEHVKDYQRAISEIKRTLKPGGRLLLVVPFLYYFHAAPSDYVRFTSSYLEELFRDMKIHCNIPLGNRSLCIAEFLHEKCFTPVSQGWIKRLFYRFVAALFVFKHIINPKIQPGFAAANLILVEKVFNE